MAYLYRFKDKQNNIIYIGKAKNIHDRMKKHFGKNGHLPEKCYFEEVDKVEYIYRANILDIDTAEKHFIKLHKPKYNTQDIVGEESSFDFDDYEWTEYDIKRNFESKYKYGVYKELNELKRKMKSNEDGLENLSNEEYDFNYILDYKLKDVFILKIKENDRTIYDIVLKNNVLVVNDEILDCYNIKNSFLKEILKNCKFKKKG